MRHLVEGVRRAVASENWYSALALVLTLPDICSKLEAPADPGRVRYARWFSTYVSSMPEYMIPAHAGSPPIVRLSGWDCYALRCAFLHEGDMDVTGPAQSQSIDLNERFQFTSPAAGGHNVSMQFIGAPRPVSPQPQRGKPDRVPRAAQISLPVDRFCEHVCQGVEAWLEQVKSNPDVQVGIAGLPRIIALDDPALATAMKFGGP